MCLGWLFSAVDIILLILFQKAIASSLAIEIQTVRIAIGVGLLGSALGGVLFAQLGDRFGRVKALGWAVVLYSLATGGMAFAQGSESLMVLRFLAGVGTGGEWSIGFALLAEVWYRGSRGAMGGLVAAMFNLGTFVAIGLYQSPLGWRGAFAVMVAPALLVIWLRRVVPESPIWLEFQRARKAGELSDELARAVRRPPVISCFRGPLKWITLKVTFLFCVMNFAFYSFSTVFINYLQADVSGGGLGLTTRQELPYQLTLNVAGLVSVILAGALSDRLGRRGAFTFFCALGGVGFYALYHVMPPQMVPGAVAWGLIFAFALCCTGFGINGVMGVLSPELYPTHLRSTGPGFAQNVGKGLGGLSGPPLAGLLVADVGYESVLVLPGFAFLLLTALIWLLPKVGGRPVQGIESAAYLSAQEEA